MRKVNKFSTFTGVLGMQYFFLDFYFASAAKPRAACLHDS